MDYYVLITCCTILQLATVGVSPYKGVLDCITRTVQEDLEGAVALYKSLGPRLISVVPMTGIQQSVIGAVAAAAEASVCNTQH
eukprot:15614-Heterococcus_DN1.PRE.1